MKLRLTLCCIAVVALAIAFLVWPSERYNPSKDSALQEVITTSSRSAELLSLMESTPKEQQREMAFLLKNMPDFDR